MNVHFIGIGGMGMSATALLVREAGHAVTGSDAECYGPPRDVLDRAGLSPILGYSPSNIPADTDAFVIGRNAKLSKEENAEVRAAHASGKPIYSFPEMLSELTRARHNVVIAGSYGKSTTTALIAHVLTHAGIDAGYFIGGEPSPGTRALPGPAALGTAPIFVLEGDEYPSAHDDARAKFLHLHPTDVVLISVVHDHVNVYPTFEEYQEPFRDLLSLVPEDGIVVACADEVGARALSEASGKKVVPYGLQEGIYRATQIQPGERTKFILVKDNEPITEMETGLLGMHNVEDIVGASAYLLERNLVPVDALRDAVADFPGVRRRLDNIAPSSRVPVFEGFGSSYEKSRAAIEAMLLHFSTRPLVVVFEPHTFGWRNRANLDWYDTAFIGARKVYVAPPETQGASTHDQLTYGEIIDRIRASGINVDGYQPENTPALVGSLDPDAVVLILTSGDLGGSLPDLAKSIAACFPALR